MSERSTSIKELKCPKCGASVSRDKNVCDYCKAQYVIEERAVLFGEYEGCNTFKELSALKSKADSLVGYSSEFEEATDRIRDLLEACKVCHIKNCQFFNKSQEEVVPCRYPTEEQRKQMQEEEKRRIEEVKRRYF